MNPLKMNPRAKQGSGFLLRRARRCACVVLLLLLSLFVCQHADSFARSSAPSAASSKTLDFYFVDTEGGAATLIVTPAGESLLVDSGNPGERDARRIAHVAQDIARLKQIDHYITTHYHADHFGGIPPLAGMLPVRRYHDRGQAPEPLPKDINPELMKAYRNLVRDAATVLRPGDRIALKRRRTTPALDLRIVAANGYVIGEKPGAPQTRSCGEAFTPVRDDTSDNRHSIAFVLTFGSFGFFAGGDLTWNTEHKLTCPKNLVGEVDVYQVDHHGMDTSNNPALVRALTPRVAVINNGARKGGAARTFATLKAVGSIRDIFQLHRNVLTTFADNTATELVANDEEDCAGAFIKLSVAADGKSYTVTLPSKGTTRTYRAD